VELVDNQPPPPPPQIFLNLFPNSAVSKSCHLLELYGACHSTRTHNVPKVKEPADVAAQLSPLHPALLATADLFDAQVFCHHHCGHDCRGKVSRSPIHARAVREQWACEVCVTSALLYLLQEAREASGNILI
jgi:hypothetical protein